jgi:hypothetical protein
MQNYEQPNFFVPTFQHNQENSQTNQFAYQDSPVKSAQDAQSESNQQPTYDYSWNQPAPNITLANSMSSKPGFHSQNSTEESGQQNRDNEKSNGGKLAEPAKKVQKEGKSENGKGWFGGIFSKLVKAPNQMILPDDKNPTVSLRQSFFF